jgi:hypothetical protein
VHRHATRSSTEDGGRRLLQCTAAAVLPRAKPMLLVRLLRPLALTVAAPLGETVELRGGVVMP